MIDQICKILTILTGTTFGAIFGAVLTIITVTVLTFISVTVIFNLYIGGTFVFIGVMILLKLYKKNKMVNIDLGP